MWKWTFTGVPAAILLVAWFSALAYLAYYGWSVDRLAFVVGLFVAWSLTRIKIREPHDH